MLCLWSIHRSSKNVTFNFPESSLTWTTASASLIHHSDFYKADKTPETLFTLIKDLFQLNDASTAPGHPQSTVSNTVRERALTDPKISGLHENTHGLSPGT